MREIKFRGLALQPSLWVYGLYFKSGSEGQWTEIQTENGATVYIDEKTIGQFTGLKDKNGKEIYEGDIFEIVFEEDRYDEYSGHDTELVKFRKPVYFENGTFKLDGFELFRVLSNNADIELVGNIYENPELLEVSENDNNSGN